MPFLVGERHEEQAADACLHIFLGDVLGFAREDGLHGFLDRLEGLADRDFFAADSEIFSEGKRVIHAATGRVRAGHCEPADVVWAERIRGDGGSECRVDTAAQSEADAGKSAFGDVVSDAGDERAVELFGVASGELHVIFHGLEWIHDLAAFLESGELVGNAAVCTGDYGVAVEDQLFICAE